MSTAISIKNYSKAELPTLAETYSGRTDGIVALTQQRITYLMQHPLAKEQDIMLIAAFENEKLISYIGMLPDCILTLDGEKNICWLSGWWTDPECSVKGIGAELLMAAHDINPYTCISSFTQIAGEIYHRTRLFQSYGYRQRYYHFFNVNKRVFRDFNKPAAWQFTASIAHLPAELVKQASLKLWLGKSQSLNALREEYISVPDTETEQLISKLSGEDLCIKSTPMLHWKLLNPQYKPAHKPAQTTYKSHFFNTGNNVKQMNIKLYWEDKLFGFICLVVSDGVLTLPYLYCRVDYWDKIPAIITQICLEKKIDVILTNDSRLSDLIKQHKIPYLFRKTFPVEVLLDKRLQTKHGLILQDGDGG